MAWTTTHLNAGSLATNTYDYNITGLSASTSYKYRAYMIVDGVEYYGNVLTGRTCNVILTLPSVTTGDLQASTLTSTSFSVSNNIITSSGNTSISEYGLLYTQESAWGNDTGLVIDYNPLHNTKYVGVTCVTSIPFAHTADVINLASNTTTFYRTYAKNAAGTAYGDIKTQITSEIPVKCINVNVEITWNDGNNSDANDGFGGSYKLYCCDTSLVKIESIPLSSKNYLANWTVPDGCYYVDFTNVIARVNNNILRCVDFCWYDISNANYYGFNRETNYFSGSVAYGVQLPGENI